MVNHPKRNRRLPYGVFEDGERTALFGDFDHACLFALGRSRGGSLVDVVNQTGIVDQYQNGKAVPGQPGVAMKYVNIRHSVLYRALEEIAVYVKGTVNEQQLAMRAIARKAMDSVE